MVFAPVLQEVAARISGTATEMRREQPDKWAYALREAVSLVRPDWVVTHFDLDLEVDSVAAAAETIADVADVRLAIVAPATSALELTETLAGLFPDGVVAASIAGPAAMASRLACGPIGAGAAEPDLDELLELCADALAELASAHVERGAQRVIVWEPSAGPYAPENVGAAQAPVVRRLETLGVPAVLCAGEGIPPDRYASYASPSGGHGAALVPIGAFPASDANGEAQSVDELLSEAAAIAGRDGVVLTEGPIPADCETATLRRLGERTKATA